MVFNALHEKPVSLYYNCFGLYGVYMYPFLQFYLLYCYMQPMRARNKIKMNGLRQKTNLILLIFIFRAYTFFMPSMKCLLRHFSLFWLYC